MIRRDGRRQIVDLLLPGDCFGFTNGDEYDDTVEAVARETYVARCVRGDAEAVAESNPQLAREIRRATFEALLRLPSQLAIVGRTTAIEKVGAFLLDMSARVSSRSSDRVVLPISRYDMADYLGLSVETVSPWLNSSQAAGRDQALWSSLGGDRRPGGARVRRALAARRHDEEGVRAPGGGLSRRHTVDRAEGGRGGGASVANTASRIASASWRVPRSRSIIRARWTSTVRTLSPRSKAMTLFDAPATRASSTSRSRGLSLAIRWAEFHGLMNMIIRRGGEHALDCGQQNLVAIGLLQEIEGAGLHGENGGLDIPLPSDYDDRRDESNGLEPRLHLQSADAGHLNIQENAAAQKMRRHSRKAPGVE